jgi:hypothetical protein
VIDLPSSTVEALKQHRKEMAKEGNINGWVFCDTKGGPIRKSNLLRRSFKPLLALAELPPIRFHDLRHTAATLLLAEGIHPKVVQERLGHSQISLTLDTYSHVLPSMQRAAADKLDQFLEALNDPTGCKVAVNDEDGLKARWNDRRNVLDLQVKDGAQKRSRTADLLITNSLPGLSNPDEP